ncbi:MAG: hypothetical protein KIT27_04125 [Legionellales bacterium]|nr:hypothetical protein [Legionellales bacterium]
MKLTHKTAIVIAAVGILFSSVVSYANGITMINNTNKTIYAECNTHKDPVNLTVGSTSNFPWYLLNILVCKQETGNIWTFYDDANYSHQIGKASMDLSNSDSLGNIHDVTTITGYSASVSPLNQASSNVTVTISN